MDLLKHGVEISLIYLYRVSWRSMFFSLIVTFHLCNFYRIFTEYAAVDRLS